MDNRDKFGLAGKTALVVGGTRGIGRAISLQLARAGAQVVANFARDAAGAEELLALAVRETLTIDVVKADVSRPDGVSALLQQVDAKIPQLSILVFAAATGVHKPALELNGRHFDFTFALNVRAFLEIAQQCRKRMTAGGAIVALSSEGAERGISTYSLVGASKGALESLCRHLAVEWGGANVRVNVLSPGTVATDAWKALPDAQQRLKGAAERSPAGRLVTAEEVALTAQFLCSDAATAISGATLVVDGGARIRG